MPSVNERFIATVRDISSEGKGIVEHECGQVFFVPGVWVGEVGEFRITGFKKRFGFATLIKLVEVSPARITPPCKHQGFGANDCGACPWQFVSYEAQLEVKETRVRNALARLAIDKQIKPIWPSLQQLGYRNRAQLKSDGKHIGYVAADSNQLVAVDDCLVLSNKNRETLQQLLVTLPRRDFKPAYKVNWTSIDIDEDITANEVVVNQRRPFRQANTAQNERMQVWLAETLTNIDKSRPVLELFAGSGNFTRVLSDAGFTSVLAVEAVVEAVDALDQQALPGVKTQVADLFSEGGVEKLAKGLEKKTVLVLDPPREGFRHIELLLKARKHIKDVLYISCDLATFSRDLKVLLAHGFTVEQLQPLDQFPHTPHVELLLHLKRA